jgi:hypothetical protein
MRCTVSEEQELLIAKQFKTESSTGDLDGDLSEDQFARCLQLWHVPPLFGQFLFRAFDLCAARATRCAPSADAHAHTETARTRSTLTSTSRRSLCF